MDPSTAMTEYHNLTVQDHVNVFYRTAGSPSNPPMLLLHGFPSSSHQYRNLIPLLAQDYHVIAPDMPGFGFTAVPADYMYTFAALAATIAAFLHALHLSRMTVYMFDYGAPVALRLATQHNVSYDAIISQNGNAYVDGFGHPFWDPIMQLWKTNSTADRAAVRAAALTPAAYKAAYVDGVPRKHLDLIDPATYTLDYARTVALPGNLEHQLDLFYDYRTNVELYPTFQAYFRKTQVPLLAAWGEGDPAFRPAGAEAFKRDLKHAEVVLLPTGHFALETNGRDIARLVLDFLRRRVWRE